MAIINQGYITVLVVFAIFVVGGNCGFSVEEMKGHALMIKTACMAKVPGVTDGMEKDTTSI